MKKTSMYLQVFVCYIAFVATGLTSIAQDNQWVWMKGNMFVNTPTITNGLGNTITYNTPGARSISANWTDLEGNFWIFGGMDYNNIGVGDLWRYNPEINMWTWMKGDTTPNTVGRYGTQGVPDSLNNPNALKSTTCSWTDLDGNLWLFGTGLLRNDLWKYDIATNEWTWMRGDTLDMQGAGSYGNMGVASPSNDPPGRVGTSCSWVSNDGDLYLFGGLRTQCMNDLWKYNIATNQWTWMRGSNVGSSMGSYGTKGVSNPDNDPPARKVTAKWTDNDGNFWMFGGDNDMFFSGGYFNDMWKYNPTTNEWTWMSGDDFFHTGWTVGNHGEHCYNDSLNIPSPRNFNLGTWKDDCGNLWMFGGSQDTLSTSYTDTALYFNDLWKYNTSTNNWTWISGDSMHNSLAVYGSPGIPSPANVPGCREGAVPFQNEDGIWFFGGITFEGYMFNDLWKFIPKPDAVINADTIAGDPPLTVNFSSITENNDCADIVSFSWNFDDPGAGADSVSNLEAISHTFNTAGTRVVKLLLTNCFGIKDSTTQVIYVGTQGINETNNLQCIVKPNPCTESFIIETSSATEGLINYTLCDLSGRVLLNQKSNIHAGSSAITINTEKFNAGTYILRISDEHTHQFKKIIIQ